MDKWITGKMGKKYKKTGLSLMSNYPFFQLSSLSTVMLFPENTRKRIIY